MKSATYGRVVFGLSAVLFGVIALMWRDVDTWQNMSTIWSLPLGIWIGDALMVALIAGGIGMLFLPTERASSIVLSVVFVAFSISCIPGIIQTPTQYVAYGSFFNIFSMLVGAIAIVAATESDAERCAVLGIAARIGLGVCAVSFAVAQWVYLQYTAQLVPAWIPPSRVFWTWATTIAFFLAAVAMLADYKARLAVRLMGLMLFLFGFIVWVPLLVQHPQAHFNWSEFSLTMLIAGAAWVVADVKTNAELKTA